MEALKSLHLSPIKDFLSERGWRLAKSNDAFESYKPPEKLGLPSEYLLTLPSYDRGPDIQSVLRRLIENISVIYELSDDQLTTLFADTNAVFSVQLIDSSTKYGSMPLTNFEGMISQLKKLLYDVASFVTVGKTGIGRVIEEAVTYLNSCQFLQTEVGSFITRIEVPSKLTLKPKDLIDEAIVSDTVNERLVEILNFVTGPVFEKKPEIYQDDFFKNGIDFLNLDVFEDIREVFSKASSNEINFSYTTIKSNKIIRSGHITDEKRQNLDDYILFVKDNLKEDIEIDVTGKIVELRSRNPSSNRNYVGMSTKINKMHSFVALVLDNNKYATAIHAHRNNRNVRVKGLAKRMKTQLKIVRLDSIQEL